jgi:hypothetical protein
MRGGEREGLEARCLECGVVFWHDASERAFTCADCRQEEGEEMGGAHVDSNAADPVLLQNLQDMGFAARDAQIALERTGNLNLEVAIDYISSQLKGLKVEASAPPSRTSLAALGTDGLNAILLRLVATATAEQLSCCTVVCRTWYAEAVRDELWEVLLLRKWGETARNILKSLAPREIAMSYRALYVRSVTTQVLSWGQGSRSEEEQSTAPRAPELLFNGLRGVGIRQVAAGHWFTCAVTWGGRVLCWGVNTQGQCGRAAADHPYLAEPAELDLGEATFALQVACGNEHAACVTSAGGVFCWGSNAMHQLGQTRGAATPHLDAAPAPACVCSHEPLRPWLRRRGFGIHARGSIANAHRAPHFTGVACGHSHTVALTAHGVVYSWGANLHRQCGLGPSVDECALPVPLLLPRTDRVTRVAAGAGFTLNPKP